MLTWLGLHAYAVAKWIPLGLTLMSFKLITDINQLSLFSSLNMTTRFFAYRLDHYELGYALIQSIQAREWFTLLLDIALCFYLIENKKIVHYARLSLALSFLYQSFILFTLFFLIRIQNTHLALTLLNASGLITLLFSALHVLWPLLALQQLKKSI